MILSRELTTDMFGRPLSPTSATDPAHDDDDDHDTLT